MFLLYSVLQMLDGTNFDEDFLFRET